MGRAPAWADGSLGGGGSNESARRVLARLGAEVSVGERHVQGKHGICVNEGWGWGKGAAVRGRESERHPLPSLKRLRHQTILLIVHLPETLMKLSLQNTNQVICRGHDAKLLLSLERPHPTGAPCTLLFIWASQHGIAHLQTHLKAPSGETRNEGSVARATLKTEML